MSNLNNNNIANIQQFIDIISHITGGEINNIQDILDNVDNAVNDDNVDNAVNDNNNDDNDDNDDNVDNAINDDDNDNDNDDNVNDNDNSDNDNYSELNEEEQNITNTNILFEKSNYFTKELEKTFTFNSNELNYNIIKQNIRDIYTLYYSKTKNRHINKNWFNQNEIVQTGHSDDANDLSSYIIQLISDTSINLNILLNEIFTETTDKNKIINLGNIIQEWINNMEYVDGSYHLNLEGINDFNTLILWVLLMTIDIKFIPSILNSHLCTNNIFSIEFLQRKAGNISLMMMSIWNKDIRDIIVQNLGNMLYTTLLNEEINITNNNNKITLYEMSMYINTFYDMLHDNIIDSDVIQYKNSDTLYHTLCRSISPFYHFVRISDDTFRSLSKYELSFNDLPESIKLNLMKNKLKKNNDNVIPISYLSSSYGINEDIAQYLLKISTFANPYNFNDILDNNFTINKLNTTQFALEPFIIYYNNNTIPMENILYETYENYFNNYLWIFMNSNIIVIKNNIMSLLNYLSETKSEIQSKQYLKLYLNDIQFDNFYNIDGNKETKILINLNMLYNKNYYEKILTTNNTYEKIQYFLSFIKLYPEIHLINHNLISYFLFQSSLHSLELYKLYFTNILNNKQDDMYNTNLNEFYVNHEIHRNNFALYLLDVLEQNISNTDNILIENTYIKFIKEISYHLDKNKYIKLFSKFKNLRIDLLKSTIISNEVKFGDTNDTFENILNILQSINNVDNIDVLLEELDEIDLHIDEYVNNNFPRILACFILIESDKNLKRFIKIFKITDEIINKYQIKTVYINILYENKLNYNNLELFLDNFTYNINDISKIDMNKLLSINNSESILILEHFAYNGLLKNDELLNILDKFDKIGINHLYSKKDFFRKIINIYSDNEIVKKSCNELLNIDLNYEELTELTDKYSIVTFILDLNLTNDKNILNLIKYFSNCNKDITTQLVSIYNKVFLESNVLQLSEKIDVIFNIIELIEHRIPKILINQVNNNIEINQKTLYKFVKISEFVDEPISENLVKNFPELIHCIKNKKIIDDVLIKSIENYDIFTKIINFEYKSDKVCNKLLKLVKDDVSLYLECIIKFNTNIKKTDKELIINHIKNNYDLLENILNNESIKKTLFKTDKEIILLKNNIGNYVISYLKLDNITYYISLYELKDLEELNNIGVPLLFNFLNDRNTIQLIINRFGLKNLEKITDNLNRNIYDKMIMYDLLNDVPQSFLFNEKNILYMIRQTDSNIISKLIDMLKFDEFNKIMTYTDIDGNNVVSYLVKYHQNIFKSYVKDGKITKSMLKPNYINQTFMMSLIKDSNIYDLVNIIKWIKTNMQIEITDYFVDNKNGSILSYCLKYNPSLFNVFDEDNFTSMCMNIYDHMNMICPFSDNSSAINIKMNLYHMACILDKNILVKLLKLNKRNTKYILTNTVKTESFNHNLLTIALFNNPESVQVILNNPYYDDTYIKNTEEMINGFEKVIEVQPASWYYLQNILKNKNYKLKLSVDEHWYGYNYKRKMTEDKIKEVTHYILDKQDLPDKNNVCDICETYKRKVVYTKCRHKVCIVCAVRSDKCANCRTTLTDKDKILM